MFGYLGHLVSLVGALVGIAGNTWDRKRKGWRKLTVNGRVALGTVLLGFLISVFATYQENAKKSRLTMIASQEIESNWRALAYPFSLALWEIRGESPGYAFREMKAVLDESNFARIAKVNLKGEAPHYSGMWKDIFEDSTKAGARGLEQTGSKFNSFLDDELIVAIQQVVTHRAVDVFSETTRSTIQSTEGDPAWVNREYPLDLLLNDRELRDYLDKLIDLRKKLEARLPPVYRGDS